MAEEENRRGRGVGTSDPPANPLAHAVQEAKRKHEGGELWRWWWEWEHRWGWGWRLAAGIVVLLAAYVVSVGPAAYCVARIWIPTDWMAVYRPVFALKSDAIRRYHRACFERGVRDDGRIGLPRTTYVPHGN